MSPMAIYRDQSFQNQSQASLAREPHFREPSLASLEIDANDDYFRRKRKPTSQSTCVIAGRNKRKATTNRSCSSGSHRIHLDLTIENASEQIDLTAESEEEEEYSFLRQFEEERTPKRISPAGPVIKHDEIEPMKFLPYFDKNLGLSAVLKSKNKNIVKFSRRDYCDEIRLKILIARVEIIDGTCFLRDPFRLSDPSTTTVVGHFAENFHLRHMDVVMLTDVKAEYKLMFDAETEPTLSVHKIIISIHENDVAFSALAQPFQWTIEPQLLTSSSEYDQHSNLELPDVHDFNERTKSFATETQLQEQQSKSQNSVSTNDFELNVEDAFDNSEMDTI